MGTILYAYDNKGRQISATENSMTISREYDALDRLTTYADAAGNVIQYAYDPVGNLTNLIYPDGKQVAYAYDAANRLTTVRTGREALRQAMRTTPTTGSRSSPTRTERLPRKATTLTGA